MDRNIQRLDPEVLKGLWRVSPAATAATLSRDDPEPWRPARHLKVISDAIRDAVTGRGTRFIIINTPPRHGKSELSSKYTPIWFLENWPHKKVMMAGYGATFAAEFGGKVRNLVGQHSDKLTFQLSDDSKAKDSWHTSKGGAMYTAGVGGPITGKGADLLLIDDPIKNRDEADSLIHRDKVWHWWTSTARTRLHPKGVIILIMTRWAEDDLAGRLLNPKYNEDHHLWRQIVMPAICDSPNDPLGRQIGEPLWPERYDVEELNMIRRATRDDWFALYQQKPRGQDGSGNVYEAFHPRDNVARLDRDHGIPLVWSMDFNRDPMCSVVGQYREFSTPWTHLTNEKLIQVEILRELILPDCSTKSACETFVEETRPYVNKFRGRVPLEIYGDVSGNHRSTAGDRTDWQIVREFFRRYPEYDVRYFIGTQNPSVKSRVNSVNGALCSADGYRRLKIDISCEELSKDFQNVRWARNANGNTLSEIDKRDRNRTHVSDALGYFVWTKLGMRPTAGDKSGLMQ